MSRPSLVAHAIEATSSGKPQGSLESGTQGPSGVPVRAEGVIVASVEELQRLATAALVARWRRISRAVRKYQKEVCGGGILLALSALFTLPFAVVWIRGGQAHGASSSPPVAPGEHGVGSAAAAQSAADGEGEHVVEENPHGIGDPARRLLASIAAGNYAAATEVAAGRFFRDFNEDVALVEGLDLDTLRVLRQDRDWVRAGALSRRRADPDAPAVPVELRLSRHEGRWKLENVRKTEEKR
jgi:hypothetical protein